MAIKEVGEALRGEGIYASFPFAARKVFYSFCREKTAATDARLYTGTAIFIGDWGAAEILKCPGEKTRARSSTRRRDPWMEFQIFFSSSF